MSTLFFFFFCVSFFKNFSQNLSDADALAKNDSLTKKKRNSPPPPPQKRYRKKEVCV